MFIRPERGHVVAALLASVACAGASCASDPVAKTHREALSGCIPSGTDADINAALVAAGATAVLCPGAIFTLTNPVTFKAPDQQLSYPPRFR